jgi:ubiquinone biosynthesis protein
MIQRIVVIGKTYRHTHRYLEIIKILTKYGFYDLVSASGFDILGFLGRKFTFKKVGDSILSLSRWERIRMVLEELGPAFIKFGQIMSTRGDLIPPELVNELKKLQDSVSPFSWEVTAPLLEKELGKPVSEIFRNFLPLPVAAASIAQVYKATLMDGKEVAVKVQRPGIKRIIDTDIEIMFLFAKGVEKHIPEMKSYNMVNIVEEFDRSIHKELNFLIEASNIEQFTNNFRDDTTVYVPQCHRDYCTSKVLTMEYINGVRISDIEADGQELLDRKTIAQRGAESELKQIFDFGFFHADPHPGNILVLPGNIICFLDFGMMGTLTSKTRELITSMVVGAINNDPDKIIRSLLKICETNGEIKMQKLELQITEILNLYFHQKLENINLPDLFNDLVEFFPQNNLKIPSDLYSLGRALLLLQSDGEMLDPDFNMSKQIEPFFKKLIKRRFRSQKYFNDLMVSSEELLLLAKDLPYEIREIIDKLKNGSLKINIEHNGMEPLINKHEQISNRITIAIILASITVGSSLVILANVPPVWNGISLVGLLGFLAATIIGLWLLISIFRHGKL